ncbi:MAG: class I SAM-dependent methyltransferase [Herminiimonas sp.]|nr:class I SAM-dependent methyltransferase [Herminiimonas sp.]
MSTTPTIVWLEDEQTRSARWRSSAGNAAPARVVLADDRMSADTAFRLASEGTALLWRGDFQNARQLLQAMARRIDQAPRRARRKSTTDGTMPDAFNAHRMAQAQRARTLGRLLLPVDADGSIPLRRAPDVRDALQNAYGIEQEPVASVVSLRELQGLIGAHEWRKKGVEIGALGDRIHPHYGVFAPIRNEYVSLVAAAPLPATSLAFDIGTGTGVLAALLVQRGVRRVVATDLDPRALACARDNLDRLGVGAAVEVVAADLYPPGRAPLIICNPPWVPARPSSPLEHAVYDPDSRMLRGFLDGLAAHLSPGGEGWLILSDLAEHLQLRSRETLLAMIAGAGLQVLERTDVRPQHPKVMDAADPLHAARAAEVTSLWRLAIH